MALLYEPGPPLGPPTGPSTGWIGSAARWTLGSGLGCAFAAVLSALIAQDDHTVTSAWPMALVMAGASLTLVAASLSFVVIGRRRGPWSCGWCGIRLRFWASWREWCAECAPSFEDGERDPTRPAPPYLRGQRHSVTWPPRAKR